MSILIGGIKNSVVKQPLGNGLESRIRGKQGRIAGLPGSGSIVVGTTMSSPITTTLRTQGMPANSPFNFVSYLTLAAQLQITSSSASDTLAGVGLKKLLIIGLDSNWNEISENIDMNGQIAVLTSLSFLRVNLLFGESVGSSNGNVGDIYVSSADTHTSGVPDTQVLYAMNASDDTDNISNISMFGLYTIPANKRLWLIKGNYYYNATEAKPILFKEDYIVFNSAGTERLRYTGGPLNFSSSASFAFDGGGAFNEKTDYEFRAKSGTGTITGTLYYEATLEDINELEI